MNKLNVDKMILKDEYNRVNRMCWTRAEWGENEICIILIVNILIKYEPLFIRPNSSFPCSMEAIKTPCDGVVHLYSARSSCYADIISNTFHVEFLMICFDIYNQFLNNKY